MAVKLSERLRGRGVTRLFYLTPLANLESILARGILCRRAAGSFSRADISDYRVQKRREKWHGYVPLFFADNTPMLYTTCAKHHDVILLAVSLEATDCEGAVFAEGNLAVAGVVDYQDPDDLAKLDWKVIQSRYGAWGRNWKCIRAAEVLIPENCPATYIEGIYFQRKIPEDARANLQRIADNSPHSREIFLEPSLTRQGI